MFGTDEVPPRRATRPSADLRGEVRMRIVLPRLGLAAAYVVLMAHLGTTSACHWLLAAAFVAGPLVPPRVREGLRDAAPFLLFVAIYDALGLVRVQVAAGGVHTLWPYWIDRTLFGVSSFSGLQSLNEVFARHHWPGVDFVAG